MPRPATHRPAPRRSLYPGDPGTEVLQVFGGVSGNGPVYTFNTVLGAKYSGNASLGSGGICAFQNPGGEVCAGTDVIVTAEMDITLPHSPAPAHTFSGTVTDSSGRRLPGIVVSLTDAFGNRVSAATGNDGAFAVAAQPGRYAIGLNGETTGQTRIANFTLQQPTTNLTLDLTGGDLHRDVVLDIVAVHAVVLDAAGRPTPYISVTGNALQGTTSLYPGDPGTSIVQVISGRGATGCFTDAATVVGAAYTTCSNNNGGSSRRCPAAATSRCERR